MHCCVRGAPRRPRQVASKSLERVVTVPHGPAQPSPAWTSGRTRAPGGPLSPQQPRLGRHIPHSWVGTAQWQALTLSFPELPVLFTCFSSPTLNTFAL